MAARSIHQYPVSRNFGDKMVHTFAVNALVNHMHFSGGLPDFPQIPKDFVLTITLTHQGDSRVIGRVEFKAEVQPS